MKWIIFLSLLVGVLSAGSLRIFNDSPYPLHAEILAADGSNKGKIFIAPQEQGNWNDNASENSVWSQTPYTVVLTCKNGKAFGVISGIQQGATVTALSATGSLFCEPEKKKSEQNQQQPLNPQKNYAEKPTTPEASSGSPSDPNWGPP